MKSSVPVLSAAKPWFSQGFSHFWPIALEFCSAHATRCMAPAALYFASRTQNRVVFRVARVVKSLGFRMSPVWHPSTPVEAVGFEQSLDLLIPRDYNYHSILRLIGSQVPRIIYPLPVSTDMLQRCCLQDLG